MVFIPYKDFSWVLLYFSANVCHIYVRSEGIYYNLENSELLPKLCIICEDFHPTFSPLAYHKWVEMSEGKRKKITNSDFQVVDISYINKALPTGPVHPRFAQCSSPNTMSLWLMLSYLDILLLHINHSKSLQMAFSYLDRQYTIDKSY